MTLYVGGLDEQMDASQLQALFGRFGPITAARVVTSEDGRCRGFAYVTFGDSLAAAKARAALDGKRLDGRMLRVAVAS